ncbi:MAG TPA: low affinity iron permease family protein [Chloroflexota bacterium]|nr:low affinity iron permease family protein [Chloroflexota bacterium]
MRDIFRQFATTVAHAMGSPAAFLLALAVVLAWAATGPLFGFSDTWQLVINTGTTVVTFLMVFLIQNTQNRDSRAIQLKLDELLRAVRQARTELVNLEEFSDEQLEALHAQFQRVHEQAARLAAKQGHPASPAHRDET